MSPLLVENSLGTEEVLDVLEAAIIVHINDALAEIYQRREEADVRRAELRGEEYMALTYEEVPAKHVHVGNFPSLVLEEVGPEAYPYIAVTTEDYTPDAESVINDHVDVLRAGVTVHCLAKAEPEGDINETGVDHAADTVFRRAVRMGEAVHMILGTEPAASRLISGTMNPLRGQQSLPWTYQHKGRGPNFWFQAVGTSYAIKSYSTRY